MSQIDTNTVGPTPPGPPDAADTIRPGQPELGQSASWVRVLRDQKKIVLIGLFFMVAAFWVCGPLGKWVLAASIATGVALALINHLATERWLLRSITTGRDATRNEMIGATLVRLALLSVAAVGLAVLLWPSGIGLLLGLAIFRLLALMMTSLTLLKELKKS